jgi:hypothetical protein
MNADTIKAIIDNPQSIINMLGSRGLLNWISDEQYIKWHFKRVMGYAPNLKNPKTFNEKMQWLKLHDRKPEYTSMVDKYLVRSFIAETIGDEYLIPLVGGPWESADEIDLASLPEQFVLKCNHDSGGVVVCRDKAQFDLAKAKSFLNRRLKKNFYNINREWPYKDITPCIIAEAYMEDAHQQAGLIDYKFFCFNNVAKFMYVSQGLEDHSTAKISFYNLDGTDMPVKRSDFESFDHLPYKPKTLETMIELSNKLAEAVDSPFLRCDLYEINGRIYFSELTFTPCSGMLPFDPPEWDEKIGEMLMLPIEE